MVVSDELPKASSKERGKSEFCFRKSEFVTAVPETRVRNSNELKCAHSTSEKFE
jgi:hypothetical protein